MANPYGFRELWEQITLDLIASLRRNFLRHKREELEEGFQWEQWQLVKLREMQAFRRQNKELMESYRPELEQMIEDVLQDSYTAGEDRVERAVRDALDAVSETLPAIRQPGIGLPQSAIDGQTLQPMLPGTPQALPKEALVKAAEALPHAGREDSFFGLNDKKLDALKKSVQDDMEKASHVVLRKTDDIYRQTIFKAETHMATGAKTTYQAIDMATKALTQNGIQCIEYKNGRRVSIGAYAEMALRTASQRATLLGEGKKRDEWGIYTVVVSAHNTACKLCVPWQAKVLIDDVFTSLSTDKEKAREQAIEHKAPLLSYAIEKGFLHPNCRHTVVTFFPGISRLPQEPDAEKALANYKAEQQQRFIERQIRKWKRILAGTLDEGNRKNAQRNLIGWQDEMRRHMDNNPQLRRIPEREKALGYDREQAKETARVKAKLREPELTNATGHSIIKVKHTSLTGEPNTITQRNTAKGGIDRSYYGADGKQKRQVSNHHHNHKAVMGFGEHGEHAHDYVYDEEGKLVARPYRELTDDERKENADIL